MDEIWYGRYAIGVNPKIEAINFLHYVLPAWQTNELVRWDQH
jgi:hypothetical protein